MSGRVVLPTWQVGDFETAEKLKAERERILSGQFFLVKIAGLGDVWRCKGWLAPDGQRYGGCGGKHRYLTLCCVEQPFSGLTQGLYAYWKVAGADDTRELLPPTERYRLEQIERLLKVPDLARAHPLLARRVRTPKQDLDVGAFTFTATDETPVELALGKVEPITRAAAKQLADRINSKGIKPPFRLPGLNPVRR